jgi:hypothetical protein
MLAGSNASTGQVRATIVAWCCGSRGGDRMVTRRVHRAAGRTSF